MDLLKNGLNVGFPFVDNATYDLLKTRVALNEGCYKTKHNTSPVNSSFQPQRQARNASQQQEIHFQEETQLLQDGRQQRRIKYQRNPVENDDVITSKVKSGSGQDSQTSIPVCVICWSNTANTAIKDCGHVCMCLSCSRQLRPCKVGGNKTCPLCRKNITGVIKLYYA
ncbi:unnamed protein product [Clavelina lepadiformis]|uniref:RING-type domain-containing protein n=1 Tax=Clavelina lepadiformis TaxID=159417 RepID=A0ABP0FYL0_CLALP